LRHKQILNNLENQEKKKRKSLDKPIGMKGRLSRNNSIDNLNGHKDHSLENEKEIKKLLGDISSLQQTMHSEREQHDKVVSSLSDENKRLYKQQQEGLFAYNDLSAKVRRLEQQQQLAEEQILKEAPQTPRTPRSFSFFKAPSIQKEMEGAVTDHNYKLENDLQNERHSKQQLEVELRVLKEKLYSVLDTLDIDGHTELVELKESLSRDKSLRKLEGSDAVRIARLEQRNQELEAQLEETRYTGFFSSLCKKSSSIKKTHKKPKTELITIIPDNMDSSLLSNADGV